MTRTRTRARGPVRRALLVAALGAALVPALVTAGPVSAHDDLVSTAPGDGSRAPTAPAEVAMVFTDALIEVGAVVVVVDERGEDWAEGPVLLSGDTARQALRPGAPDGTFQARWRVVSSDGHPIAGAFDFAVGPDAPTTMPSASAAAAAPASASGSAPAAAAPSAADAPEADARIADQAGTPPDLGSPSPGPVVVGALGALVGVALFVAVVGIRGRRAARTGARS